MTQAASKFANRIVAPLALGAMMVATPASADYPGALWTVDSVDIRFDEGAGLALDQKAMSNKVRAGLRKANETYFFGDRPVRMVVTITGPDTMLVTVTDRKSGKALVSADRIAVGGGIAAGALAWMDGLECAGVDCSAGLPAVAAAPASDVPALAAAAPTRSAATSAAPQAGQAGVASVVVSKGMPIPRPRPSGLSSEGTAIDLASLGSLSLGKTPSPSLENTAPIRISRFNTDGLGEISYTSSDRLVVAEPRSAAVAAVPRRTAAERTLFGRLFFGLARFLGISGDTAAPEEDASQLALAPANPAPASPAATPSAVEPRANSQPFQPSARWRLSQPPAAPAGGGDRLAALGSTTLPAPTATQPAQPQQQTLYTGLRVVPSPGLRPPSPRSEQSGAVVTPIRVASLQPTARERQRAGTNLSVRLSPEVFSKYSPKAFEHLLGSYGNQNAKVRLVADEPGSGGSVDRVLAARGLKLDRERYARAERVYWGGETGSRGFWISMPRVPPSAFVLIASAKASVIANVQSGGNGVRVSDAVAEALGMQAGSWSDVQVVALRQLNRTAQRTRARTALQ